MRLRDADKIQVGDVLVIKDLKPGKSYKFISGSNSLFTYHKEFHENPVVESVEKRGYIVMFITENGWHMPNRFVKGYIRKVGETRTEKMVKMRYEYRGQKS